MNTFSFFTPELSPPLATAARLLCDSGCKAAMDASEATHILLPVPTKEPERFQVYFSDRRKTVIGGNLPGNISARAIDLLVQPDYLAKNADITADCTETLLRQKLPCSLSSCNILIIGWGRIGVCLCRKLSTYCPRITVSTKDPRKAAICKALGYGAISRDVTETHLRGFRVIVNTAPADEPLKTDYSRRDAIILDLASTPGLTGSRVIPARGLPGKMEPEESGKLIAATILDLVN